MSCNYHNTASIYIRLTLTLHDALPILRSGESSLHRSPRVGYATPPGATSANHRHAVMLRTGRSRARETSPAHLRDRKSTRLNSSHLVISYAVFFLKLKHN